MTQKAKFLVAAAFVVCAVVAVSAVVGLGASLSPAINTVVIHCSPNANRQVDPIVAYGHAQSAHLHTPAGADDFSSTTTVANMVASTTVTSCDVASDHSLMWFPTPMTPEGTPATITDQFYYLTNHGYHVDPANVTPNGLRFIAGDSACASTACDSNVIFRCINASTTTRTVPTACDNGGLGFSEIIYSEHQCWDGQSLGQGMGDSTPANVIGVNIGDGTDGQCSSGQTVIPGIAWGIHVGGDGVGGYLSSDAVLGSQTSCPGCSGHFDFVFGQSQAALSAIDSGCLNVSTTAPPGVQATCIEKPNGDGTSGLWALDANGRYTIFVTR